MTPTVGRGARTQLECPIALFLAAVAGKVLAPLVVRRLDVPTLAVGSGPVRRDEVGLIFAQVGLTEGVLEPDLSAALALVITATTLAGSVLLRRLWPPTAGPSG